MKHLRFKPGISLFACAACALGLLLWARLLLVSSPPRIATAQPAPAASEPRTASKSEQPGSNLNVQEQAPHEGEPPIGR